MKAHVFAPGMLASALLIGCTGEIDRSAEASQEGGRASAPERPASPERGPRPVNDPPPPPPALSASAPCKAAVAVGTSPFRRLTRWEYANTVRDLLGIDASAAAASFPEEERVHGFDNNAAALTVSPLLAERYHRAAESLAEAATATLPALTGCPGPAAPGDACARAFVPRFGRRAYRRPLRAAESERLLALYRAGAVTDARNGFRLVLTAVLQAAPFLYRAEAGTPVPGHPGVHRLGGFELATRLSYLLWGTTPDETLLAAAEKGTLGTPDGLRSAATALLGDPRARAPVRHFFDQWLGFLSLPELDKDIKVFPAFTATVPAALATQAGLIVDELFWGERGQYQDLFTGAFTFASVAVAKLQGLTGPTTDRFVRVGLDTARHAGVLTSGPVMALLATRTESSPIARGKFVREHLFCQTLPPPPPDVPPIPKPGPGATTRERFAQHTASPQCAGCHRLIDPVGFGLEGFDGVGRARDQDSGKPVDLAGELSGTDVDGPFTGAAALGRKLATSDEVRRCVATSWFRHAFGRDETPADRCALEALRAGLAAPDARLADLLLLLVSSEAFALRAAGAP